MSVYTDVIICFEGTENELKNIISKHFDELDHFIKPIHNHLYRFTHNECDIDDFKSELSRVVNHKKCKGIWSNIDFKYKRY